MYIWAILTGLSQLPYVQAIFLQTRKMIQGRGDKNDSPVLTGDVKSVTNIIFPSIMIIILISPGITPVRNSYPYFTDEVTETPKVNCLPTAM